MEEASSRSVASARQLIRKHRDTKKQQLLEDLREAEELSDEARARILRQQLNALIKENA